MPGQNGEMPPPPPPRSRSLARIPLTHDKRNSVSSNFVQILKTPSSGRQHKSQAASALSPQLQNETLGKTKAKLLSGGSDASSLAVTYRDDSASDSEESLSAEEVLQKYLSTCGHADRFPVSVQLQPSLATDPRQPTFAEEKAFFEVQRVENRRKQHASNLSIRKRVEKQRGPSVLSAARALKKEAPAKTNVNTPAVEPLLDARPSTDLKSSRWVDSTASIPWSPGIVERLSQFADFGENGRSLALSAASETPTNIVLHDEPDMKGRATLRWWSLLTLEEKAAGLLSMPSQSRIELFDSIPRKEYSEAVGRALMRDSTKDLSVLLELDPEDRAELLTHITVSQRARALAALQYDDRLKTIRFMHHNLVGPALVNLSHSELLKTLNGLDERTRAAVFAALPPSEKAPVLAWTPAAARAILFSKMEEREVAELLVSLPVKECCTTLKAMQSNAPDGKVMGSVLSMPHESKDKVITMLQDKDVAALLVGVSVDTISAQVDGLGPEALARILRCLNSMAQALILDDLTDDVRAAVLRKLSPRSRIALIQAMPHPSRAPLMALLDAQDLAATLRALGVDEALQVLEELEVQQQAEVLTHMSGRDRKRALQDMTSADRASVLAAMAARDRTSELKNMQSRDVAETLAEMPSVQQQADTVSEMTATERSEVLAELSNSDRQAICRLLRPEVLAATLAEMTADTRRQITLALQPDERAAALSAMSTPARAALLKSVLANSPDENGRLNPIGLTLQTLPTALVYATLQEMDEQEWAPLLLALNSKARAAVMDAMTPHEAAEALDAFLLEERATTLRCMQPSSAAEALAEMHPNKKAVLIAALSDKERQKVLGAMTPRNVGSMLSALPLSDCVSSVKALEPSLAAAAIMDMSEEERAMTVEALPVKDRTALVASMQPEDAAPALTALRPDDIAVTLRGLPDDVLARLLAELPVSVRDPAVMACPAKSRARAMSALVPSARASILNGMDTKELSATVRGMAPQEVEATLPNLGFDVKAKILAALPTSDAVRALPTLSTEDRAELLSQLPVEVGALYLKTADQPAAVAVLTSMTAEQRSSFLNSLPDKLRRVAVRNLLPTFSPSRAAAQQRSLSSTEAARRSLVQGTVALKKSPLPPRSSRSVSPPRPRDVGGSGGREETAVLVSLRFDEDYTWVVADDARRSGWTDWIRSLVCSGIRASPQRLVVAALRPGSVEVLFRVLPLWMTPDPTAGTDTRSAHQLAEALLSFVAARGTSGDLPMFLGGLIHPPHDRPADAVSPENSVLSPPAGGYPARLASPPHPFDHTTRWVAASPAGTVLQGGGQQTMLPSPARFHPHTPSPRSSDPHGSTCGVGVAFGPTADRTHVAVTGMIPDGEAARSRQVTVGDLVTVVDGIPASRLSLAQTVHRLRGAPGTTVSVGFASPYTGKTSLLMLTRIQHSSGSPLQEPPVRISPTRPTAHSHSPSSSSPRPPAPPFIPAPPRLPGRSMPDPTPPASRPSSPTDQPMMMPTTADTQDTIASDVIAAHTSLSPPQRHPTLLPSNVAVDPPPDPGASQGREATVTHDDGMSASTSMVDTETSTDIEKVVSEPNKSEGKVQAIQTDEPRLGSGEDSPSMMAYADDTAAGEHEIWGSLKRLDGSIEERRSDVSAFTSAVQQMQSEIPSLQPDSQELSLCGEPDFQEVFSA